MIKKFNKNIFPNYLLSQMLNKCRKYAPGPAPPQTECGISNLPISQAGFAGLMAPEEHDCPQWWLAKPTVWSWLGGLFWDTSKIWKDNTNSGIQLEDHVSSDLWLFTELAERREGAFSWKEKAIPHQIILTTIKSLLRFHLNFTEELLPWGHTSVIVIPLFVSLRSILQGNWLWMKTAFYFRNKQAFLVNLMGMRSEKYFWIGLSNTEEWGSFRWTSGESPLFTHWNTAMPAKLCMGSTLLTRVQLKFTQVSAFHPLVLEITGCTFCCACSCRWPTLSGLVFDANATSTITAECQVLFKSISCKVLQKQIFNGLDWRRYCAGVNKVHGLIFFQLFHTS